MANDSDWAVVVGLNRYPGLKPSDLGGPVNDATDFYTWLVADDGGAVPGDNVKKILSSDPAFAGPFADVSDAIPTVEHVKKAFEWLDGRAIANQKAGKGRQIGRRLYLYFAGHGIVPAADDDETEESALLMANAADGRLGHHIPGRRWLNWFYRAGYFEELVLLMDCCRDVFIRTGLASPHFDKIVNRRAMKKAKRFLGFGTKWGSKSREWAIPGFSGQDRGVFTVTLMKGLRGGAAEPDGRITAGALKSYLINNMKTFLHPDHLADPEVEKEPDVEVYPKDQDFVLHRVPSPAVPKYPVTIRLRGKLPGKRVEVVNNRFQRVEYVAKAPPRWVVQLERGLYQVRQVGGEAAAVVEVGGTGGIDVELDDA